jgi:hypothetical protein
MAILTLQQSETHGARPFAGATAEIADSTAGTAAAARPGSKAEPEAPAEATVAADADTVTAPPASGADGTIAANGTVEVQAIGPRATARSAGASARQRIIGGAAPQSPQPPPENIGAPPRPLLPLDAAALLAARRQADRPRRHAQGDAADQDDGGDGDTVGGDDRLRYLAMVAATSVAPLRPAQAEPRKTIAAVLARSRAECARRCGSDGFCDPSSPSGCSGEYCLGIAPPPGDRV